MLNFIVRLMCFILCVNFAYAKIVCKDAEVGQGTICMSDQPNDPNLVAGVGNGPAPATLDKQYNSPNMQNKQESDN